MEPSPRTRVAIAPHGGHVFQCGLVQLGASLRGGVNASVQHGARLDISPGTLRATAEQRMLAKASRRRSSPRTSGSRPPTVTGSALLCAAPPAA
ncbi:hypothetical protein ABTW96_08680 [Nocardia beijingensis]|uniref:hypothetical protein n=1 Tax=Nocardia beijingensis TaxID=95162 RepID=UPI003332A5C8